MNKPLWQWDEINQIGTDYADLKQVQIYDERMGSFRDIDGENEQMFHMLSLPLGARILEIGCGTGRFALAAAQKGFAVTAVDVSAMMLDYVRAKAANQKLDITLKHCGFLTMDLAAGSFDAVVSGAALHHLPDAWKQVALNNISNLLNDGGQFILRDVVFVPEDGEKPQDCFKKFIDSFNEQIRAGAITHVKQEYSTFGWIMEGLLTRAGFTILAQENPHHSFRVYHCRSFSTDKKP